MDEAAMDEAERRLDAALGEAIRQLRVVARISQDELAERTRLSKKTIGRIETGKSSLRMPQMLRISAALEVTMGELLEKAESIGG
jgi:putative transcriptional regulator